MILPTKHTTIDKSLLGFGCYILQIIEQCNTIDLLWEKYKSDFKNKIYPAKQTFDNLLLAIIFLYSIGAVGNYEGVLKKCV